MRRMKVGAMVVAIAAVIAACGVPFDYDNDGRADVVWMTADGAWHRAGDPSPIFAPGVDPQHGTASLGGNLAVPGDYDGNGVWEPAVVFSHTTWITSGARGTFTFAAPPNTTEVPGLNTPPPQVIPVPADYDGDGKTDAAWYRESDATWWIEGQPAPIQFGLPWTNTPGRTGYDVPQPADYDGDHKADLAVYSPTDATFTIRGRAGSIPVGYPYGMPAAADYNGDGRAEAAVLNKIGSSPATRPYGPPVFSFGNGTSIPVPGGVDLFSVPLPVPANYDGTVADEPAARLTSADVDRLWINGQPDVALAANTLPVAKPANVLTGVRIEFGIRCLYGTSGFPC